MGVDISIIIPVYKAKETLDFAVNSILKQKFKYLKPKIEIILSIDDQKNYAEYQKTNNEKIDIVIKSTKKDGSGAGNARNNAIKHVKGTYIGFLDADDEYSQNYLEEMYYNVRKSSIVTAPTYIYKDKIKITEFRGIKKGLLTLRDISKNPCSFHPFLKRELAIRYEDKPSQDIFNLAELLNISDIKMIKEGYYKLNIRNNSYTRQKSFNNDIDKAYRFYQIKAMKEKKIKIAREFAIRRILNKKYINWAMKHNSSIYYEFIKGMKNEKRKNLYI